MKKEDLFNEFGSKKKNQLDNIIKNLLLDNSKESMENKSEFIKSLCTGISLESFYTFHKLVDGVYKNKCKSENLLSLLVFIAKLKTVLWSCDLMLVEEKERKCFFEDLIKVKFIANSIFISEKIKKLDDDSKTFYGYIYLLLCNYSNDMLSVYFNYPFKLPIHIKCGHCENDVHSIIINPAEISKKDKEKFVPRIYNDDGFTEENLKKVYEQRQISDSKTVEGYGECNYNEWDIFNNSMRFLKECDEKYLTTLLPYLYGTHICGKCGKNEIVIKSNVNWIYSEQQVISEPKEELILWLMENTKLDNEAEDKTSEEIVEFSHFMLEMAIWFEKSKNKPNLNRMYNNIIDIYMERNGKDVKKNVKKLQSLVRELLDTKEIEALSKTYSRLANEFSFDFINDKNNRYDLSYISIKKAINLLEKNKKTDSHLYVSLIIGYSIIVAESEEGSVKEAEESLLKLIELEKNKEEPDIERLGDIYQKLAYLFANRTEEYQKVFDYFNCYLEIIKKIYGENSDMEADALEELAEYYEMADDIENALKIREKALEINIVEMGEMYLFPPIFKGIAIKKAKFLGEIDESEKFTRVMSVVDSYIELADDYEMVDCEEKVLDCRKKALALLEWEFKKDTVNSLDYRAGILHKQIGDYYYEKGKRQLANKEYKKSKEVYEGVISAGFFEDEVEKCERLLKELEELD